MQNHSVVILISESKKKKKKNVEEFEVFCRTSCDCKLL